MARTFVLALLVFIGGCGFTIPSSADQASPAATGSGMLAVWVSADSGWESIDVSVDGVFLGTLTQYLNTQPGCAATSATVVVAPLAPGVHTVTATSNAGTTWSSEANVTAGACRPLELTCPNRACTD